jgi:hypothetical protein
MRSAASALFVAVSSKLSANTSPSLPVMMTLLLLPVGIAAAAAAAAAVTSVASSGSPSGKALPSLPVMMMLSLLLLVPLLDLAAAASMVAAAAAVGVDACAKIERMRMPGGAETITPAAVATQYKLQYITLAGLRLIAR